MDLLHVPHLFWKPQAVPCPYVVTVHDLLDHLYKLNSDSWIKRTLHFELTKRVLHRAARIFAVSNFSKKDTERLFQVPGEKIEVIYNALDDRFRQGHATDADRKLIAERYQVTYPFLLYAGRISPHKNIVRIIEAFAALKAELEKEGQYPDLKLIIIGDELAKHPDLRRAVIKTRMQNDVRFLGFVPIGVLRIFYDLAKVFVFPSLYEGLRTASAGSHGARHAGRDQQHVVDSRSRGQCGGHGQSRERLRDHACAAQSAGATRRCARNSKPAARCRRSASRGTKAFAACSRSITTWCTAKLVRGSLGSIKFITISHFRAIATFA